MEKIRSIVKQLLQDKGYLLYVTTFGSHLYGTASSLSDGDYMGLFLPSVTSLMLDNCPHSLQYNSGNGHSKNTAADTDIQLWTLQHWLRRLRQGEIRAMDMLFSMTARHVWHYDRLHLCDQMPLGTLIDCKSATAYIAYVRTQTKKYGIKGSRIGLLKDIVAWLDSRPSMAEQERDNTHAGELFAALLEAFYDPSYCFCKEDAGAPVLYVLGKGYPAHISVASMRARLHQAYVRQGEKARLADTDQGIDWKAVSHAVRALLQMQELLAQGTVQYPLACAPLLVDIKEGKLPWRQVEAQILALQEAVGMQIESLEPDLEVLARHDALILRTYATQVAEDYR